MAQKIKKQFFKILPVSVVGLMVFALAIGIWQGMLTNNAQAAAATVVSAKVTSPTQFTVVYTVAVDAVFTNYSNLIIDGTSETSVDSMTGTGTTTHVITFTPDIALTLASTGVVDIAALIDLGSTNTFVGQAGQVLTDGQAPTFASVALGADEMINATDALGINISVTTTGVEDGQTVSCTITDAGAGSVGPVTSTTTTNAATIATGSLAALADGLLTATCNVSDVAGNPAVAGTDTATKETLAPVPVTYVPADNAIGVAPTTNLTLNFTETIYIRTGNVVIKKASDNSTVETIDIAGGLVTNVPATRITINPNSVLEYNTAYYVQYDAGILEDVNGNDIAGITDTTSWSFTTTSKVYLDTDSDGIVDTVRLYLPGSTTGVDQCIYEAGDWSVTTAGTILITAVTGITNELTCATDEYIDVEVTSTNGTGGSTAPAIRYSDLGTAGSVAVDGLALGLTNFSSISDGAAPVAMSAYYMNSLGTTVDMIVVEFSEAVSWNLNDLNQFNINNQALTALDDDTIPDSAIVSSTTITLTPSGAGLLTGVSGLTEPTIAFTPSLTLSNRVFDSVGVEAAAFAPISMVDYATPYVSTVDTSKIDGTYGVGQVIDIAVSYSESVIVSVAVPTLALNSTGTAPYNSGTGTNTLIFRYTVAGGESSADLDYSTINDLALNGSSIDDAGLNPATNTLPAVGTFAAAHAIVIETTAPTFSVTSVSPVSGNTAKVGDTVVVTVTAGGAETGLTASGAQTVNGVNSVFAEVGLGVYTITYTVSEGDADILDSAALPVSITLKDVAGNIGTQITTIEFGTAPGIDANTPVLAEVTPVTDPTADTAPNYTFSSDEAGTITLGGGCDSVTASASAGSNTITLDADGAGGVLGNATYNCTLIVTDAAGNISTTLNMTAFTVDTAPPTVSTYSPADGATGVSIAANLVLTFNENVQVGTGNVVIYKADNSVIETIDITSGLVTFNGTTGVTINPTANLLYSTGYYVQIAAGAIEDVLAHAYAGIADTTTWNFTTAAQSLGGGGGYNPPADTTPPTNTSISINSGAAETASQSVTLTLGATDAAQMMIANSADFSGANWESYATSKTWLLTGGVGEKTVYAKFQDAAGNISAAVSDTISSTATTEIPADNTGLILQDPAPAPALPEGVNIGTLVKRADMSSVYFIDQDNRRHAFPNEAVYFSYYPDFSGIQIISSSIMAAIPLGSNVTMRPGTYLVKIQSDPKVYAVSPYGVLKWISNEAMAISLYGSDWATRIVDVEPTFFTNYQIGPSVTIAIHPTGSAFSYLGDNKVYYVDGGVKKYISTNVFIINKFQNKFIIRNVATSITYPDGADLPAQGMDQIMTLR